MERSTFLGGKVSVLVQVLTSKVLEWATFCIMQAVHFVNLAIGIGSRLLYRFWHFIKPYVRRVYIYFAVPKQLVYYEEFPNLRPAKSEAEMAIEKLVEKLKRQKEKPKGLVIKRKTVDDSNNF